MRCWLIIDLSQSIILYGSAEPSIIALTATALKEVRKRVYASGMNDFVNKSFNPIDLEQKLFNRTERDI